MAYGYYRPVTVAHGKAGTADTTGFPMYFTFTDTRLKTVANGGAVTNASGHDIVPTSDTAGTTPLKFRLLKYDGTAGTYSCFVKIPLSHTVDYVWYLQIGNAAITTFQGDTSGTWDSNFKTRIGAQGSVGTTLVITDDTVNGNFGAGGNNPTAASGPQDGLGAVSFTAGSSQFITTNNTLNITHPTIEGWFYIPALRGVDSALMAFVQGIGGSTHDHELWMVATTGQVKWYMFDGAAKIITSPSGISAAAWHYIVGTGDGTTSRLYIDGAQVGTLACGNAFATYGAPGLQINGAVSGGTITYNTQTSTEWRVSDIARSASYVTATWNNINDPSTFFTVGAEVASSTAYTMTAAQGSYALNGQLAALRSTRTMSAARGSYALTGEPLGFSLAHPSMVASQGSYALSGQSVSFRFGHRLTAAHGSYTLTGQTLAAVVFVPPKHYRVANYAAPLYRLVDTGGATYTATLSITPEYTITDIPQDE